MHMTMTMHEPTHTTHNQQPLTLTSSIHPCTRHSFDFHPHLRESEREHGVTEMRLTFPSSTDFYGRVTLYQLKVLGREVAGE